MLNLTYGTTKTSFWSVPYRTKTSFWYNIVLNQNFVLVRSTSFWSTFNFVLVVRMHLSLLHMVFFCLIYIHSKM
ncbi:hypothetical protein EON70_00425 [bacterium]|nr:MAG: hypothetical protein EON70_00425 [bacterium]